MITLEKYSLKYVDDFVEFLKEFQQYSDEFNMLGIIEEIHNSYFKVSKSYKDFTEEEIREFFPRYVEFMLNCEKKETIEKKGWVEAESYFICKDGKMIGELMFRKRLNPYLLTNSLGHIGYKIKQSERRKGYASEALRLMLEKAWNDGYTELMVSCNENNIGSSKVIERNGGILNRLNKRDNGTVEKEYWIFK